MNNRSPRRPPKAQPPLRGRSAAVPRFGQQQNPIIIVRQYPPISSGRTTVVKIVEQSACVDLHPDWIALHKRSPELFKLFDQPWKLLVAILLLMIVSMILGALLI